MSIFEDKIHINILQIHHFGLSNLIVEQMGPIPLNHNMIIKREKFELRAKGKYWRSNAYLHIVKP
jgi:hypothetical protein